MSDLTKYKRSDGLDDPIILTMIAVTVLYSVGAWAYVGFTLASWF